MSAFAEEVSIKEAIKQLMKSKKITYKDLADSFSCSVPTIKRMLNKETLTISRLMDICKVLGMDVFELTTMMREQVIRGENFFTDEQEHFLSKHLKIYTFYRRLMYGYQEVDYKRKFKMSTNVIEFYKIKLHELGLVQIDESGNILSLLRKRPQYKGSLSRTFGEHLKKEVPLMIDEEFEQGYDESVSDSMTEHLFLYDLMLSKKNKEQFLDKLEDLFQEYAKKSRWDYLSYSALEMEPVSVVLFLKKYSIIEKMVSNHVLEEY